MSFPQELKLTALSNQRNDCDLDNKNTYKTAASLQSVLCAHKFETASVNEIVLPLEENSEEIQIPEGN